MIALGGKFCFFSSSMEDLQKWGIEWVENHAGRVVAAVVILLVGLYLSGFISGMVSKALAKRDKMDPMIRDILARVVRIALIVLTLVIVLDKAGVPIAGLLTVVGAAGLAIGLALQGTLSNIAAGVMLLLLRPFTVGHAVSIGGTVYIIESLGLFLTYARLPDGPKVTFPNSQVWGTQITNFSVTHNDIRRLNETIGISYDDDIDKAIAVIQKILDNDPRVLKDPETLVGVSELGESSVNLVVWAWLPRADWWAFKLDFTKKVKEELDKAGITIPFPQRDVHVYKEKK